MGWVVAFFNAAVGLYSEREGIGEVEVGGEEGFF